MEPLTTTFILQITQSIDQLAAYVIPLEALVLSMIHRRWFPGDTDLNIICGVLLVLCYMHLPFSPTAILQAVDNLFLQNIPTHPLTIFAHLLVGDLCFYTIHRLMHTRYLFALDHIVHHSSEHLNFSTNFRHSLLGPLYTWAILIIPVLLGFHPALLFASFMLANAVPFFCHTEHVRKLGWLEAIFNTPSHHRVHHGKNPQYRNKNYGGMLIIWDRLFGTYAEEVEPVEFGVTGIRCTNIQEVYLKGAQQLLLAKQKKPLNNQSYERKDQ